MKPVNLSKMKLINVSSLVINRFCFFNLKAVFFLGIFTCLSLQLKSQCTNMVKWPSDNIQASTFNILQTVSNTQYAGDYFVIQGLAVGETYQFASSNAGDYITVRDKDGLTLKGSGNTPYSYVVVGDDIVTVHINLVSPPCGSQSLSRTTTSQCTTCDPVPPNVGVGTNTPISSLDVNGKIRVSDDANLPVTGMIRWNDAQKDFEGYDGSAWRSFTKSSATWGNLPKNELIEKQKGIASDGSISDVFGYTVSISGEYAIVGAPGDDIGPNDNQGSAYIFKRNGTSWTQQAKLTAVGGSANDYFGYSVGISGDYAIIGSVFDDIGPNEDQGSSYIFKRSGTSWIQEAKLIASDGATEDVFGVSVSISGDYAIIGAPYDDIVANEDQGSAYIFKRNGISWTQQSKLIATDGAEGDFFGYSAVSISADYALIGAPNDAIGAIDLQGSAYIFKRSGTSWTQQAKLIASDGSTDDFFGISGSISGDYAIIGAFNDDIGPNGDQGSAYIFKRSGTSWTQQAKLVASDGEAEDFFGSSVSISGDYVVIGARVDKIGSNTDQGSAYVFIRSGTSWTQEVKLTASDGAEGDTFGSSVSISGDYIIIGAKWVDVGAIFEQGAVYFFNR